jgi:regulator of sirC expression with transglutaminase-like and TPR domain
MVGYFDQMTKQKPLHPRPIKVKTSLKKDYTSYWLVAGLLLTLIVYLPSLWNGIINWDDTTYINNPYVKDLSPAGIVNIFSVYFIGNYHPLTLLSLGVDHLIGGEGPFMFHFTNLLLHLLNSFLVFLLVKRLTQNNLLAVFTFILFGVHTLHVESVAWISERKDVLYSFFFLVSLTFYTKYASSRKRIDYGLALFLFLLSILAKGQAVVLVAILPFFDYLKGRKWFSIKVLAEKIPFLLLSLIFTWIAFRAQESANALHFAIYSLPERFAFASYGLTEYLIKSILPISLSALYPFPLRSVNGSIPLSYWLYIIPLPVYITGSYFLFKRSKIYAFGLSLFFLNLLPLLQLIPVGGAIMADRYFYIPSVGLLLCFAYGLLEIRNIRIKYALFILFIVFLSGFSFSRVKVWKDSITLWNDVIRKDNNAVNAFIHRGNAYKSQKQWEHAIADYSRVIELDPKFTDAYYERGSAYSKLEQWDKAIHDYSDAIGLYPEFTDAYYDRGIAYGNLGQQDKAINDFTRVIGIDPKFTSAYYNRGVSCGNLGQWEKAISDFSKAIDIDPKYTDAYFNRGVSYSKLKQWEEAIKDYSSAIEIDPKFKEADINRSIAYRNLNRENKK